MVEIEKKKNR